MRNLIKIIILTLTFAISSCSSSFISRTKHRTIKLVSISKKSIKIGIENDLVNIKFDRNDLIQLFEKEISEFPEYSDPRKVKELNKLKSLKDDKVFDEKKMKGTLPFMEYELKFHLLLKKGKAEIVNRKTNNKLQKIKYKFTRDKLGGENAYFFTKNGKEIYEVALTFGE
jgi:hypothetical protein